jgi:hypothetical protein
MIRLLLCLLTALGIATALLLIRQQRLQLRHDQNVAHARIVDMQRVLWQQQLQIAVDTAPEALRRVRQMQANRPPADVRPEGPSDWSDLDAQTPEELAAAWDLP